MPYNRDKAVVYAHLWATSRNPAYYDFSRLGGDCTSFISQCLYAGCGVMNYQRDNGWYYDSVNHRAPSWTGVEFLYRFLTANKGPGPYAGELPMEYAQAGDVIQLNFNGQVYGHSLLVVAVKPEILITTHTDDSDHRPLHTYRYRAARLLHIESAR